MEAQMKKALFIGALSLAALSITSAQTMMKHNGYVRVVHGISDAPAVDVFLKDAKGMEVKTVDGAPYTGVTPYGDVPEGKYDVTVTVHDDKKSVLFSVPGFEVKANTYTTVAAVNMATDRALEVFKDPKPNRNRNKAQITVYHLSYKSPNVDAIAVDLNNAKVVSNLAYRKSATVLVSPMGVNLNVVPAGAMSPVVYNLKGISVAGGKSYSVFAFGLLDGKDAAAFKLTPNEDKIVKGSMGYK
jgi:hypothetical protein